METIERGDQDNVQKSRYIREIARSRDFVKRLCNKIAKSKSAQNTMIIKESLREALHARAPYIYIKYIKISRTVERCYSLDHM